MYCSLWYMAVNKGFMLILLLDGGNSRGRRERKLLLYLVLWVCVRIIQVLIFYVCLYRMCVAFCFPPMLSAVFLCYTQMSSPVPSSLVLRSTHPLSSFSASHPPLPHPFDLRPKCSLPSSRYLIYIASSALIRPPSGALPNTGITVDF